MKPEFKIQKTILENQILIMEEMWRNTSYTSIKESMQKAIRETRELIATFEFYA